MKQLREQNKNGPNSFFGPECSPLPDPNCIWVFGVHELPMNHSIAYLKPEIPPSAVSEHTENLFVPVRQTGK